LIGQVSQKSFRRYFEKCVPIYFNVLQYVAVCRVYLANNLFFFPSAYILKIPLSSSLSPVRAAECCTLLQCVVCTSPTISGGSSSSSKSCSVLQCVAARGSALQCVAFSCSVSCVPRQQSRGVHRRAAAVAVCCSALQCVALCCSALQCVAACCSVSCVPRQQSRGVHLRAAKAAVCCSVLQCVAGCCSVLQCVPVR